MVATTVEKESAVVTPKIEAPKEVQTTSKLMLRFSPYAWAKIMFMCNATDIEISGMGISDADDPMLIHDFILLKQTGSMASTDFDMAHYEETMFELCDPEGEYKLLPKQCQRVWIHTHPGMSPRPSTTDVKTFAESWGVCDWAVMCIVSSNGDAFASFRMKSDKEDMPSGDLEWEIPVTTAWGVAFQGTNQESWLEDLKENVKEEILVYTPNFRGGIPAKPGKISTYTEEKGTGQGAYGYPGYGYGGYGYQHGIWEDDAYGVEVYGDGHPNYGGGNYRSSRGVGSHAGGSSTRTGYRATPTLKLQPTDLLYPLDSWDLKRVLFGVLTESQLTEKLLNQLLTLNISPVEVNSKTREITFQYKCTESGETFLVCSEDLVQFSSRRFQTLDPDISDQLSAAEDDLSQLCHGRGEFDHSGWSFKPFMDAYGEWSRCLIPWLCQDGLTLWISDTEMETLKDIEKGCTEYNDVNSFLEPLSPTDTIQLSDDDDTEIIPLPELDLDSSGPQGEYGDGPQFDDESEMIMDSFRYHRDIVLKHSAIGSTGNTVIDIKSVEDAFTALRRGAVEGGWEDKCDMIADIFRIKGYSIDKAIDDVVAAIRKIELDEITEEHDAAESQSEPQADLETVNDAALGESSGSQRN